MICKESIAPHVYEVRAHAPLYALRGVGTRVRGDAERRPFDALRLVSAVPWRETLLCVVCTPKQFEHREERMQT
eukprot:6190957-Pleurochrysis_carterae.AAC.2